MKYTLIKWLFSKNIQSKSKTQHSEAGFSMIEVVTVVIIIGILSAIAVPAWDAFVQRQRIRAINNQILSTLQSAQTQARGNKESMSIVFYAGDNIKRFFEAGDSKLSYKVFPTDQYNNDNEIKEDIPSETLNIDGNINEDKIEIVVFTENDPDPEVINFNDQGAIPEDKNTPVYITIRTEDREDGQKCTVIQTLLGSMRTDEGKYNAPKGCQTD